VKTYYLHGNRDFLIGAHFLNKTGMTLLSDPSKIMIADNVYVLCHGDSLCTADIGYQVFRGWVRKAWLQKLFLKMPLNWRRSIANHLRSNSGIQYQRSIKSNADGVRAKTDVTLAACAAVLREQAGNQLIHGHTHLPAHHQENLGDQEWQRWVLSDWDLDHPESGRPRASALMIDQDGARYADLIKA
jgi:UDP-2,3-diacylglucosamine hydrolase